MTQPARLNTYWVTCADGLENLLVEELIEIGASIQDKKPGRITIQGTLETAYRVCLWSRLASRVLLPIHHFALEKTHDARDVAEEIYEGASTFDWSLIFSPSSTFAIRLQADREIKVNPQFATLRAKDGVVDSFMEAQGRRPSIDTKQPEITLFVQAGKQAHDYCLDLSGDSLHRRGYRHYMTDAPIKENLAAAILRLANWHKPNSNNNENSKDNNTDNNNSNDKPFDVLIDPMCGSGTFIIEALMMHTDRAPGLQRQFGFMGWHGHDNVLWQRLKTEAQERHQHALILPIPTVYAFDADWEAVKATRQNIIAAGFEDLLSYIRIEERVLADWPDFNLGDKQALLITNPPYGERLGDKTSNRALYQGLGWQLQKFLPNQQAAILASQIEQADVLPLQQPQTLRLMNGNLPIYVRHGSIMPRPEKPALLANWQSLPVEIEEAQDFVNRLQKNISGLKKQALREQVSCLRLYDADLPDFNLAIDLYDDNLHVQEYAPPKTIDPEKAKKRFNLALAALRQVLGVPREKVFIKTRARQKGQTQYEKQSDASKRFVVQEGNIRVYVNLTDYLDTGLFLDHRPMRLRIAAEAKGKHFLNLYSYTSTASVHAAVAGAASTTSVDLSNTYLNWSKQNFALNGLTVDHNDQQHQFFAADVFEWLKDGHEQYDLIFIDPPTFSNSKKFQGTFDIQRDHASLLKRAMNRLSNGGVLYFSNNFRQFELDDELSERFSVEEITPSTIGFDFKRNQKIHRAWRIKHL